MYIALRPPWGHAAAVPMDAGVVAVAPSDAGVAKPKKKHGGGHRRPAGGQSGQPGGLDSDDQAWQDSQGGGGDQELPPQLVQLTAADRQKESRGDDVTPGAQKIDMANGADGRKLEQGEIESTISSQSAAAQQCVMSSATNTNLAGTISVKLVVDGTGHVTRSKVEGFHYMFEHGLLACMQSAVKKMKFPATGAPTLVTMPINFN
ncbi:MAG: AgmX/PglI C-terminal domain-containing protein [Kofleriaceae bacterium]